MSDLADCPPIARATNARPTVPIRPFKPAVTTVDRQDIETHTRPAPAAARCLDCAIRAVCMPRELTSDDLTRLDAIICSNRTVRQGEALYHANDSFQSIYIVRSGSFKTVIHHRDGQTQVTGFQLAGDTLGLDGVCHTRHGCDAVALEDSTVCIIPFYLLEVLCREVKAVQHHVHRMMSREIVRESGLMMLLGTMSAEQRLAAFLVNFSGRLAARGYSSAEFNLRVTREEIGSFLGMKIETVSRMFSKFHKAGLVDACGKRIRILDLDRLARI